ncbi:hypothetical protein [Konateibacter massiliensis]|uniref:hypothetical protein n=1 Tax=Konateibacter massiliensis TaxID=2002841 RepID=UPI000C144D1E|nr:hypothetical protein [Konateibacter massiliensis]
MSKFIYYKDKNSDKTAMLIISDTAEMRNENRYILQVGKTITDHPTQMEAEMELCKHGIVWTEQSKK